MGIFPISTFHCVWWHCGITVVLLIFTTSDPNICVCVRACTALKVCTMKCRFFVSACNCESLCCLQAPLHLIVAGSAECIYSLFSLSVSVPLSSCVLYPPRTIFLHHPCASTGMCLRAWATSGHSLSTSATCLMTQPTSAWLGRRRASRRFLSKVYESLSLEESFFQEGEGFFFFSARFGERCHLNVERLDSSVPSLCLCLSSVYFDAFYATQRHAAPRCLLSHF